MKDYDYIYVGSAPYAEECVQVSDKTDYVPAMKAECRKYIEQLRQVYGQEPEGAALLLKREVHDFGCYYEVVCKYDMRSEEATDYALRVEDGLEYWQDLAA